MLKITLFLLVSTIAWSQVGIGTTNPNASLDIRASTITNPNNTEGLLVPRVEVFSTDNPTILQDGLLVYLTTTYNSNSPGFYYWNHNNTTWTPINSPKNSMNDAYNQGGPGLGRIITADNGALEIQGSDGLVVTSNVRIGNQFIHEGDTNTHISFTPDRVQITAGGRNFIDIQHSNDEITINELSTQTDFRVESGNLSHLLFTDGSEDVIGINNNAPKALIDMAVTDVTAPVKTDGLLIPRMDVFPPGPDGDQNGMIIFITGDGVQAKGIYYWDWDSMTSTGTWVAL